MPPILGLCKAAVDDKLFHEFEDDNLFTNGEDGERTCYEYCEPYEGVVGYVGFDLDLMNKKCICYFEDSTTFPTNPPAGSATTMSSDPGSAQQRVTWTGTQAPNGQFAKCVIYTKFSSAVEQIIKCLL